nr:hypothetical protein [Kribbella antibiotica]
MLDDEPLLHTATVARTAVDRALELVMMGAPPLASHRAGVGDDLDLIEQLFFDQGFVSPVDPFVLVGNEPEVVTVAYHLGELVDRDLLRWGLSGCSGAEATVIKLVGQIGQRVIASRVQLEGDLDERTTYGIKRHSTDLTELKLVNDVQVAERCEADRATVLGLLTHLVRDVSARLLRLVLVESGQDAVHELADGSVVDRLGGGDDGYAALP